MVISKMIVRQLELLELNRHQDMIIRSLKIKNKLLTISWCMLFLYIVNEKRKRYIVELQFKNSEEILQTKGD